tara:strand:- start:201 stop:410 length:210 start_codon:yes stop_codon:yes gene_type:complete
MTGNFESYFANTVTYNTVKDMRSAKRLKEKTRLGFSRRFNEYQDVIDPSGFIAIMKIKEIFFGFTGFPG